MKKLFYLVMVFLFSTSLVLAQDPGWPRQLTNNGSILILYTPQVADWNQYETIDFRMAFSLTPYQGKQVVGVIYINATTNVDTYNHMVSINNMNITDVHFPGMDDATAATLGQTVRTFIDVTKTVNVSMERIVACTPKKQNATQTVSVKNDPPTIFVSNTPAILLQLEGQPGITDATPGGIQYVFNANWPVFFDKSSSAYFLFDNSEWQKATQLGGPWTFTSKLPSSLKDLAKNDNWKTLLKSAVPAPGKASASMPKIFYTETPAEIILFQGPPVYSTIPGTGLKYATNTNNNVFYSNTTSDYYYLAAGRWFSASGLNGPWTYATPNLPADFANIPGSSPAARILSSVPGTDEAADAVMIAQIPTKTTIDPRAAPPVTITYSGPPKYVVIEGTGLSYIENTTEKVIMVSDDQFYACVSGLWYVATKAQGPWILATSVPQVIYTIPATSPVYNVTYVTQTVTSTGAVQASYTAGYMGAFVVGVGVGVIIASGTGWYYPPYMYYPPVGYPICYAGAMTYGAYAYHPYGYYGGAVSYHASYNPYTGTYARSATAYGPYGSASVGQAYNPYTGTAARGASVSTPYGTRSAGQAYNPYTGASAATRQGSGAYGQAGTSVYNNGHGTATQTAHATNNYGQTVAGARNTNGAAAIGASGLNGSGGVAKAANGDMYAAKDGNVYKNTGDGWSQASNTKPTSSSQYSSQTSAAKSQSSLQSSAGKSQGGGSFKQGGGAAPSSEMSGAAADRQRGNAGASQWGGGGGSRGGFGGGGWGGDGRGGGGGFGGGGGGFGGRR
jgi:hypothetical protein